MKLPLSSIPKTKIGSCPHGLPMGACPICSGGGASGGAKKTERPVGEMSWDECFAIGQQMKAQKLAQLRAQMQMEAQLHAPLKPMFDIQILSQKMAQTIQKLENIIERAQVNPTIMNKIASLGAKAILVVADVISSTINLIQKPFNLIREKLADIQDKLNAMFGELKAATEKKISDRFKDFKKKAKSLFGIFEPLNADDEEKQIEESKRLFELKNILNVLKEKLAYKNYDGK